MRLHLLPKENTSLTEYRNTNTTTPTTGKTSSEEKEGWDTKIGKKPKPRWLERVKRWMYRHMQTIIRHVLYVCTWRLACKRRYEEGINTAWKESEKGERKVREYRQNSEKWKQEEREVLVDLIY